MNDEKRADQTPPLLLGVLLDCALLLKRLLLPNPPKVLNRLLLLHGRLRRRWVLLLRPLATGDVHYDIGSPEHNAYSRGRALLSLVW